MDNTNRRVYLNITIAYEDGDLDIFGATGTYSDLCWVEEELQNALRAVRSAMGRR